MRTYESVKDAMKIEDEFRELLIAIVRLADGDDVEECVEVLKVAEFSTPSGKNH